MCKKEVGLSCDKFRHMLMVNGLGAGFVTHVSPSCIMVAIDLHWSSLEVEELAPQTLAHSWRALVLPCQPLSSKRSLSWAGAYILFDCQCSIYMNHPYCSLAFILKCTCWTIVLLVCVSVSIHAIAANHRFSCFTKGPWMIAMFPHYHRSSSLLYRTTTYLKSEWNIWCSFHGSTPIEGPLWAPYLKTGGPIGWPG